MSQKTQQSTRNTVEKELCKKNQNWSRSNSRPGLTANHQKSVILREKSNFRKFHFSQSFFNIFSRCKVSERSGRMCATQKIYIPCILSFISCFPYPYLNHLQTCMGGKNPPLHEFFKSFFYVNFHFSLLKQTSYMCCSGVRS